MKSRDLAIPRQCSLLPAIQERPILSRGQAAELERIFKVLANATRLRILHAVVREPGISVGDLADAVGMKPQAVSNQLRRLVDRGIVAHRRDGNSIRYHVLDVCTIRLLDQGFCLSVYGESGLQIASSIEPCGATDL